MSRIRTMPQSHEERERANEDRSYLMRVSGMGMEFAGSIIGMVLLGWLIDQWAETDRMWTIILGIVGIIGGGNNFIRKARMYMKEQEAKYKASHPRTSAPSIPPETPPDHDKP